MNRAGPLDRVGKRLPPRVSSSRRHGSEVVVAPALGVCSGDGGVQEARSRSTTLDQTAGPASARAVAFAVTTLGVVETTTRRPTMTGILDSFSSMVTPDVSSRLANSFGVDPAVLQKGASLVGPVVLGSFARRASTPDGANSLMEKLPTEGPDFLKSLLGGALGGQRGLTTTLLRKRYQRHRDLAVPAAWVRRTAAAQPGRPRSGWNHRQIRARSETVRDCAEHPTAEGVERLPQ